jgi:DNA-3-methyladenine glycosylase I
MSAPSRCGWARLPFEVSYHDEEWGVPEHDDGRLFELLVLEGAQAGLSWSTILNKREGYRRAFAGFDPRRVARYTPRDVRRLLGDAGIVRHRGKIEAAVANARTVLGVQREHGSLDRYVWGFVGGRPVVNTWRSWREVPAETETSRALSRDLRGRGFRFVGPTICYAFMQAAGLVNDHTVDCFRHAQLRGCPGSTELYAADTRPSRRAVIVEEAGDSRPRHRRGGRT